MRGSVIFVYALDDSGYLKGDVTHQSLIGYTIDDSRGFRAKTFNAMRCGI